MNKGYNCVRLHVKRTASDPYIEKEEVDLLEALQFGVVSFKDFDNYEQVGLFVNYPNSIIINYVYNVSDATVSPMSCTINKVTGIMTYVFPA